MISTSICICGHRLVKRPGETWFKCYRCLILIDVDGNIKPLKDKTISEQYRSSKGYNASVLSVDEKKAIQREKWRRRNHERKHDKKQGKSK